MNPKSIRRLFPVTRECVYFNHASNGPLSRPALEAMKADLELYARQADYDLPEYFRRLDQARTAVAGLLSAAKEEIAFTANTSQGIYIALGNLSLRRGDRLIVMDEVFPTVRCCADQNWPEVERLYIHFSGRDPVAAVKPHLTKRTRAVIVDWVNYFTGEVLDLDRLGRFLAARSIRLVVDGMQGVGCLKIDPGKTRVDFLAAGGSKWLFSGQGIGFLYVNRRNFRRLGGCATGWLSRQWRDFSQIRDLPAIYADARRFEMGTRNALGCHALAVNIGILRGFGLNRVESKVRGLVNRLRRGLAGLGGEVLTPLSGRPSGIVTWRPARDPAGLYRRLTARGVVLSLRNNCLRFSPHFYNNEEEVVNILDVMRKAI